MAKPKLRHRARMKGTPAVVEIDGRRHLRMRFEVVNPETGATTVEEHHAYLEHAGMTEDELVEIAAERAQAFAARADNSVDPARLANRIKRRLAADGIDGTGQGTDTIV